MEFNRAVCLVVLGIVAGLATCRGAQAQHNDDTSMSPLGQGTWLILRGAGHGRRLQQVFSGAQAQAQSQSFGGFSQSQAQAQAQAGGGRSQAQAQAQSQSFGFGGATGAQAQAQSQSQGGFRGRPYGGYHQPYGGYRYGGRYGQRPWFGGGRRMLTERGLLAASKATGATATDTQQAADTQQANDQNPRRRSYGSNYGPYGSGGGSWSGSSASGSGYGGGSSAWASATSQSGFGNWGGKR